MLKIILATAALATSAIMGFDGGSETGSWSVRQLKDDPTSYRIHYKSLTEARQFNMTGGVLSAGSFDGLNPEAEGRQNIEFAVERAAGTLSGFGVYKGKSGSGMFSFEPDTGFFNELAALGFNDIEPSEQWVFAVADVTLEYASGMKALELPGLDTDNMLGYRAVGGDVAFAQDLRAHDIAFDDIGELIAYRVHDITPAYVAEMKAAGLGQDVDMLLAFKVHDITPDYVAAMRKRFPNAPDDEILAARIHDLDDAYIAWMAERFERLPLEELIAAKIHDLNEDFVSGILQAGLKANLEQLLALRIHDATPAYIAGLRKKGVDVSDPDAVIALKIHDIH